MVTTPSPEPLTVGGPLSVVSHHVEISYASSVSGPGCGCESSQNRDRHGDLEPRVPIADRDVAARTDRDGLHQCQPEAAAAATGAPGVIGATEAVECPG